VRWIRQKVCLALEIGTESFDNHFIESLERARSAGIAQEEIAAFLTDKYGTGSTIFFSCKRFTETVETEVEVEVEDPPADDPSGPGGPAQEEEEEVEVEVGATVDDDDDDDDTAEEAPFECPEGFEAVQINGEWRCQKIGDDTPKVGRMRPTGGSYYQPRNPSLAATAKAYRFR